ncbi:hypothetical protein M9H77_27145 [Catharanthus roseus]|uniref:Uncharacterized protein n=1 Tax=Catharanthus roseus TaxID=4058 RepID=A0ACC0AED0_CATRO|nr:hypothetical protein M9H77_27145 [Catharanthus roseus]
MSLSFLGCPNFRTASTFLFLSIIFSLLLHCRNTSAFSTLKDLPSCHCNSLPGIVSLPFLTDCLAPSLCSARRGGCCRHRRCCSTTVTPPFAAHSSPPGLSSRGFRLDRGIVNSECRMLVPNAIITHLTALSSDHRPLLLKSSPSAQSQPKPFCFESIWTRDNPSFDVINEVWEYDTGEHIGNVQEKIKNLHDSIEQLESSSQSQENILKEENLQKNLDELLEQEQIIYKNKAKAVWLEEEVIKSTVFSMKPNKSHGPDGMSPCSFKTYWHIVAPKVIQVVQHFFSTGHLLKSLSYPYLHHTDPKNRKSKQSGTHSCPIFLCNMCYKIITKILASYLKSILDRIILPSQNAFFLEEANERDALEVKKVLDLFCKLSRQSINQEKSSIHYSQNVDRKTKEKLNGILAIGKGNHKSTYLGMPFCKRRSKKQAFSKG